MLSFFGIRPGDDPGTGAGCHRTRTLSNHFRFSVVRAGHSVVWGGQRSGSPPVRALDTALPGTCSSATSGPPTRPIAAARSGIRTALARRTRCASSSRQRRIARRDRIPGTSSARVRWHSSSATRHRQCRDALDRPNHRQRADSVSWNVVRPAWPVHPQPRQRRDPRQHPNDKGELAEFDADVEHEQRHRDGVLRQTHLSQRAVSVRPSAGPRCVGIVPRSASPGRRFSLARMHARQPTPVA